MPLCRALRRVAEGCGEVLARCARGQHAACACAALQGSLTGAVGADASELSAEYVRRFVETAIDLATEEARGQEITPQHITAILPRLLLEF